MKKFIISLIIFFNIQNLVIANELIKLGEDKPMVIALYSLEVSTGFD